ncbi:MAG: hypothetical protein KAJ55_06695 [Anaerolineales bacterium]|nr:hypothetical protein [Anaerolineales bacterium]
MKNLVTEVRLWPPKKKQGKVLASGYFLLGGMIKVRCGVIRNKHGNPWLVLPYHSDDNDNRYNDVEAINREHGDALKAIILKKYSEMSEEGNFDQASETAVTPDGDKPWE